MPFTYKSRFIPIAGALNFRDFGGYKTEDGGIVKTGKLFRSGYLAGIEKGAYADFAALDIGVICDLRRDDETSASISSLKPPFDKRVAIPIAPGSSPQLQASFDNPDHDHEHRIRFMKNITREIARDHVEAYRTLFHLLLNHLQLNTDKGFLLHCTAGKDRTGFGAAMILSALGVSEADIFADYLLTNEAEELIETMRPMFNQRYGGKVDDTSLRIVAGVREEYLRAAFDVIIERHGSIRAYLDAVGMSDQAILVLKKRLIDY